MFIHEDDKMNNNVDDIDQTIWAEIPLDYDSGEVESFLKEWRSQDNERSHKWKSSKNDQIKIKRVNAVSFVNVFRASNVFKNCLEGDDEKNTGRC